MLRATQPTIAEIVLDVISLEYHETIMAPSGHAAEKSKKDVLKNHKGKYIAIGGHSALDIARSRPGIPALPALPIITGMSWDRYTQGFPMFQVPATRPLRIKSG
jgi:hypothetical protein